jgi:hypothetical protein
MPLVRDCSCRGDSAGFAHLDCLIKYAEQKSKGASILGAFDEPWRACNNCTQLFQNQLSTDMASAFVSFAEATYGHPGNSKWDRLKIMSALQLKINALNGSKGITNGSDKLESTIDHLLSIIDRTKKDLKMNSWVHKPKTSEEYQYYKMICGEYEAYAHMQIAMTFNLTEEGQKLAIGHFKKARAIYNIVGMKDMAQQTDIAILMHKEHTANKGDAFIPSSTATYSVVEEEDRKRYERSLSSNGMNSDKTIIAGLYYADALWNVDRGIEAERLAIKVATASRQVLGPHHEITIEADKLVDKCKVRSVSVLPDCKLFQALRYEKDGEICVVSGPVEQPRNLEDERIYHIASNLVMPKNGMPVICHGLVSASHLNGELGEVRNVQSSESGIIRFGVCFEKKGLIKQKKGSTVLVKLENLRIAFELPNNED